MEMLFCSQRHSRTLIVPDGYPASNGDPAGPGQWSSERVIGGCASSLTPSGEASCPCLPLGCSGRCGGPSAAHAPDKEEEVEERERGKTSELHGTAAALRASQAKQAERGKPPGGRRDATRKRSLPPHRTATPLPTAKPLKAYSAPTPPSPAHTGLLHLKGSSIKKGF